MELSKEEELRRFANVIFDMLNLGYVGRAAFIDDCLTKFKEQKAQANDTKK